MAPEERFARAADAIEKEIDALGITEEMDKTIHYFAQTLGLYPRTILPRLNVRSGQKSAFTDDDRRFLELVTVGDRMLYEHFKRKFDRVRVDYTVEAFEKAQLKEAMGRVEVKRVPGRIVYDMHAALIGDGFWGRDSRGTLDCCRWTGPGDDSALYIPSLDKPTVSVAIEVRGWLSSDARSGFRVAIWGEPVNHRFERGENLADVVRFLGRPRNGVLKLEFHVPAQTDEEVGNPNSDGRRKGMLISCIVVSASLDENTLVPIAC